MFGDNDGEDLRRRVFEFSRLGESKVAYTTEEDVTFYCSTRVRGYVPFLLLFLSPRALRRYIEEGFIQRTSIYSA